MPCTDGTPMPSFGPSGCPSCHAIRDYETRIQEDKTKIDKLTDMLCSLCRELDSVPKSIASWWDQHKAADARKLKAETRKKKYKDIKDKALSKLTKEEKIALDLIE